MDFTILAVVLLLCGGIPLRNGKQYEYAFCGYAYIIEYVFSYCFIFAGDKFGTTLF